MTGATERLLQTVAGRIRALDTAQAAGISGGKSPLPKPGEGDIDVFIYCDSLPASEDRKAVLAGLGNGAEDCKTDVFSGGRWGSGDLAVLGGVETWLMYFTVQEALAEVESILAGEQPDRTDNGFYPIGRLGMLHNMAVLFDKTGFLKDLQSRLAVYPQRLSDKLARHHLEALRDTEDLSRAVTRRDPLFYHFALDLALDHFLQALFAMNRTYFPSRKRSLEYIREFAVKPERCGERLLQTLSLGGRGETVPESYAVWESLTAELAALRPEA